jgi:hypothetical protein
MSWGPLRSIEILLPQSCLPNSWHPDLRYYMEQNRTLAEILGREISASQLPSEILWIFCENEKNCFESGIVTIWETSEHIWDISEMFVEATEFCRERRVTGKSWRTATTWSTVTEHWKCRSGWTGLFSSPHAVWRDFDASFRLRIETGWCLSFQSLFLGSQILSDDVKFIKHALK